jgi:hypothetical protein
MSNVRQDNGILFTRPAQVFDVDASLLAMVCQPATRVIQRNTRTRKIRPFHKSVEICWSVMYHFMPEFDSSARQIDFTISIP